ncbi:hypothetical protein PR202_ga09808 [Eleusine coracana subsp. coracana]|uniref:Uncharacterized protein n=1 Tax=Eleusine coracana subsp. coracana TaxID=191504 RepID=A0AAV5C5D6_ELECO|nr:hypothetical protein PR202_ga09808 [Eleusine coracana subsp. coracana]
MSPCRRHRDGRAHASLHRTILHSCTVMGRLLITCMPRSRHANKLNFRSRAFKSRSPLLGSAPMLHPSMNTSCAVLHAVAAGQGSSSSRSYSHQPSLWFHSNGWWRGSSADRRGVGEGCRDGHLSGALVGVAHRHRNGTCHYDSAVQYDDPGFVAATSSGDVFYVGDEEGSVVGKPAGSYGRWAGRHQFKVHDILGAFNVSAVFKKGADSVLVVDKHHFDACDGNDPIDVLPHGNSAYVLDRVGPFYFISDDANKCEKGKKTHHHCLQNKYLRVKELVERYEAVTHTKVWTDIQQERRAELEQVNQMCELLERELRFMTVDEREQHTVPSLELLERNLEAAMYKVRCEKDRKIGGEINYLENIIRGRQEERYGLCDKLAHSQNLKDVEEGSSSEINGLDLKLGFN